MQFQKSLVLAFVVAATCVYSWAIYSDPEGFKALFISHKGQLDDGSARFEDFSSLSKDSAVDGGRESAVLGAGGLSSSFGHFKLEPPSEGEFAPDFLIFRASLRQAIEARDLEAVLAHTAPDVIIAAEGEENGKARFSELLEEADVGETYWGELAEAVGLSAGRGEDGRYCAPYLACVAMPEEADEVEPHETALVIHADAGVYAAPDLGAPLVTRLSYEAVSIGPLRDDDVWAEVLSRDGRGGFIAREDVRLLVGYRAHFERREQGWSLTAFVSGS